MISFECDVSPQCLDWAELFFFSRPGSDGKNGDIMMNARLAACHILSTPPVLSCALSGSLYHTADSQSDGASGSVNHSNRHDDCVCSTLCYGNGIRRSVLIGQSLGLLVAGLSLLASYQVIFV